MSSIFGLDVNDKRVVGQDGISATDSIIAAERIVALNLAQLTTIADDDLYVMQTANGEVKKITGATLKSIFISATFDPTIATNFGTQVQSGAIKIGNSQGNSNNVTAELYFSGTLKLYNTSNVNIATFTNVSNTCNLDLKGGLLTTFTASTNAQWNGLTILPQYGGTGLTNFSGGDLIYGTSGIGSNDLSKLSIGTNGHILKSDGSKPVWSAETEYTAASPITLTGTQFGLTTVPIAKGGTALTSLGTTGQVLTVNSGATALEYTTPVSGGSNWSYNTFGVLVPNTLPNKVGINMPSPSFAGGNSLYVGGSARVSTELKATTLVATAKCGIMNLNPTVPLAVGVQANGGGNFTSGFYARSVAVGGGFASNNGWAGQNPYPISIVAEGGGYFKTGYLVASDRRIKTNIEDVIDTDSLTKLRQIRCRNYEYIDKISRGNDKTIGFIAQEVKEVYPNAVSLEEEIIPDIYKNIDCVWNVDGDKFKMSSTDLTDVSGGEFLFYCRNTDDDEEGEDKIGIVGNNDNTFTFDKKYDTIFCYGRNVKDFNRLEPDKLFILNFSATQEIDKIQQTHLTKIETLEAKVQQLEINLALVLNKIDTLEI
jgi:hypothetical protein